MLKLQSKAFEHNQLIPAKYSCDGENISPPLHWTDIPDGTKSFILIMDDPNAPPVTWDHWIMYNILKESQELSEGMATNVLSPTKLAKNSWHTENYGGPCPPHGQEHRYYFKLYALKDSVKQKENISSKASIESCINKFLLEKLY